MQGHFWHLFLTQFLMLFHMVASVLLSMVAFLTIFWLAENLQQPIRIFEIDGYWSYHGEQNGSYHVKEHKHLYQKLVSKVTLHFVWGHFRENKQWQVWPTLVYHLTIGKTTQEIGFLLKTEKPFECKSEHYWCDSAAGNGCSGQLSSACNQSFSSSKLQLPTNGSPRLFNHPRSSNSRPNPSIKRNN